MRAGISRVVVEIIILVIAVALALLIFSPISGYIFGSLGRTATVGGTSQIQVLNAQITTDGTTTWVIDVKNLGPGTPPLNNTDESSAGKDFQVYVDGVKCSSVAYPSGKKPSDKTWDVGETLTLQCSDDNVPTEKAKQHNIVIYGPGNTQAQYLYYPPPS